MNPLRLSAAESVTVILLSVSVCFAQTQRRRGRALLGNLGISPSALGILFAAPALLGEAALRLAGTARS